MKFETILELDEEGSSIEEVLVQLQKSTTKVILLTNETDIEFKELSELKPFPHWELEDREETAHGTIYTIRRLSADNGGDDDSFDNDDETWIVFREDAFEALTKHEKKVKRSKRTKPVAEVKAEVKAETVKPEVVTKPLFPVKELQTLLSQMKEVKLEDATVEEVKVDKSSKSKHKHKKSK